MSKDHIFNLAPSIVGLVETKVGPYKAFRVTNTIPQDWNHVNNYSCSNKGRIWVCWNANIWNCTV